GGVVERKTKCKGKGVFASLFGVGAPEALVIGVVALLVFGPKGLAEVARNLGKTLREFQPTIRELQDVSREFKSTLEREIGLDDIQNSTQGNYSSKTTSTTPSPSPTSGSADSQVTVDTNGLSSPKGAYSSEDYLKITEEQLKASAAVQQKSVDSPGEGQLESQAQSQGLSILMSLGNSLPFPQPLPLGPNVYSYATAIRNPSRSCSKDASTPEATQKRDVTPQKRSIAKKIKKVQDFISIKI
ncbi:hypothetical protein RJ639_030086, partial [Escallonia herrerae]